MSGTNVFGRLRASSKIGPDYDQEGHLVEVETREDELQQQRLAEIIDLLVAAGYFRARIRGLSAFDKVVGGLTWGISICNFDIDVDLLFQENSTIGQKIALTEKIVNVLPKMKCPHRIEPHQVQGLDFKSIYPVIQWLVKKVVETRAEMGDHIRAFSISQFDKYHKLPLGGDKEEDSLLKSLETLHEAYRPVRKYKRLDKSDLNTEESKVSSTLLEYGKRSGLTKASVGEEKKEGGGGSDEKNKTGDLQEEISAAFTKVTLQDGAKEADVDEEEEIRLADEKKLKQLMGGMKEITGRDAEGKLSARTVGSIIGMQSEEMQEIAAEFAEKRAELKERAEKARSEKIVVLTPQERHERNVAAMEEKLEETRERLAEVQEIHEKAAEENEKIQEELSTATSFHEQLAAKMEEFDELESQADVEILQKLKDLIVLNEKLKKQEVEFKENCRQESAKLKENITKLEENLGTDVVEDDENLDLVEKQLKTDSEKLAKIRSILAAKNRKVAMLSRKIDEVPTRAELTQYQKRFVELYDQIAATQLETKQFFTMYNTLDDKRQYLKKEVDLLDSIYDNFEAARGSPETMTQYLRQFEKIVEGVKMNKIKVEKKREAEKMHRDELKDQYLELVEQQRLYVKTIQAFQEECRKNEILVDKMQSLGIEV